MLSAPSHLDSAPQACQHHRGVAAFYDLDGTLCSTNVVHAYGYFARNAPTLGATLLKTGSLVASLPFFLAADLYSRKLFNDVFYRRYQGESEDRLKMMADELFEEVVRPSIYRQGRELVAQSRRAGHTQVLVTGALDLLARPVADYLGIDHIIANELEYVKGYATGQLRGPLVAGATKAARMRRFALEHDVELDDCFAYSDSMSDYPMLAVVGKPSVINPDRRLKRTARQYDWPILRFS
ncbi:MAG: HAD-IB family hydrolase [Myxococcota bacterium]|nr:HAD-IB family hydrolase [Myxococcota bacterium]